MVLKKTGPNCSTAKLIVDWGGDFPVVQIIFTEELNISVLYLLRIHNLNPHFSTMPLFNFSKTIFLFSIALLQRLPLTISFYYYVLSYSIRSFYTLFYTQSQSTFYLLCLSLISLWLYLSFLLHWLPITISIFYYCVSLSSLSLSVVIVSFFHSFFYLAPFGPFTPSHCRLESCIFCCFWTPKIGIPNT